MLRGARVRIPSSQGLVLTAQSAGTLVAATLAGWLCTLLSVGAPKSLSSFPELEPGGGRTWERLPLYLAVCAVLKLAVLLPCLPALAWAREKRLLSRDGASSVVAGDSYGEGMGAPLVPPEARGEAEAEGEMRDEIGSSRTA